MLLIGEMRDEVLLLLRRLRGRHIGSSACDGGGLVQEPCGHMAELHGWGWAGVDLCCGMAITKALLFDGGREEKDSMHLRQKSRG